MKNTIILIACCFSFLLTIAQPQQFQWAVGGGSWGSGSGSDPDEGCFWIGTDAAGNVYGATQLYNSYTVIDTSIRTGSFGWRDFAVFSYRCDGSFRWVRYFGNTVNDEVNGLNVDHSGNVYIIANVGVHSGGSAHFGDSIIPPSPSINKSLCAIMLDSTGSTKWISMPGPDSHIGMSGVWWLQSELDNNGNICVLSKIFGPLTWNGFTVPQEGFYVVKFSKTDGQLTGITKLEMGGEFYGSPEYTYFSIDQDNNYYISTPVDQQNLYIGGDTIVSNTQLLFFTSILCKFNNNGNYQWHTEVGGYQLSTTNHAKRLGGKPLIIGDHVYSCGVIQQQPGANFFGVPIVNNAIIAPHANTVYIARFHKNTGAFVSVKNLQSNYSPHFIALAKNNNSIIASGLGSLVILNQNDTIKPIPSSSYGSYPFVVEIDTALTQFNWSVATPSKGGTKPQTMTVDLNGNIYMGGTYTDSLYNSFGQGIPAIGGNTDFFIAKVATTNTNCGCTPADPKPQMISLFEKVLTVQGTTTIGADSLAWLWGDGTSTPYLQPGTTVSHTYAQGGNYTVCLRAWNICGVSDSCFQVLNVGVNELVIQNPELVIYPNPFNDALNIELPENMTEAQIALYDLVGKQVLNMNLPGNNTQKTITLDTGTLEPGIYIIHLVSKHGGRFVGKVVRK
jgi:hypothetical protein